MGARTLARMAACGLTLIAGGLASTGCAEVESNLVESQPYELKTIKGSDIKVVRLEDRTAERIDLQTARVEQSRGRKVVPHEALIYNPEGAAFVYERARPKSYVRRPVEVVRVEGDQAILAKGPPPGATVVTVGAAELLATEYEILNQHP